MARDAADNIKAMAAPFIDFIQVTNKTALENFEKVAKPLSEGNVGEALKGAGENLADAGGMLWGVTKDVGKMLYNVFANAAKFLAAGLEWGFKRGVIILQNGFIAAYNATPLVRAFGEAKYIEPPKEASFSEILSTYDLKGVTSGTEFEKWWTDFSKNNPAPNTTTQSNTTTNAPVENKPVPEVKKETEVQNKLTNTEDNKNKKVEVEFKNGIDVNVQGKTSELPNENRVTEMIKDALRAN
jgi:hypothetical protein